MTAISVDTSAATKAYALVIGNNGAPPETNLPKLRYADDDAVRFYAFFRHFSDDVSILTVPDTQTQRRYPKVATVAEVPTLENFEKQIATLKRKVAKDKAEGATAVLYLVFSGHGAYSENGAPYLALSGGKLTQDGLFAALKSLNADFIHFFIDACYAEGVLGFRGMFDKEFDTNPVRLSEKSVQEGDGNSRLLDLPGLGVVMASSEHQETHEWSQIEAGIFTHEVLSGLAGPADINQDGSIEYSELVAFISAANRDVEDERGKLRVIARPPERRQSIPLVSLNRLHGVSFLVGDPARLGHFHIELENGQRYLDANLGNMRYTHIAIPKGTTAFLRTENNKEALISTDEGVVMEIDHLNFSQRHYGSRGSIETALAKGLFLAEFGVSYYKGYIDSTGLIGVRLDVPRMSFDRFENADLMTAKRTAKKRLFSATLSVAGVSAIAAGVLGGMALKAKNDFNDTELQRPSQDVNDRYSRYATAFWCTAAVVPVALALAIATMPKKRDIAASRQAHRISARSLKGGRLWSLSIDF